MAKYVVSDIHGAYSAYQKLKEKAGYDSETDRLYILGDVLDGNNRHPEDALRILDDVMADDHIQMILGNHEVAHLQYCDAFLQENRQVMRAWENYLCDPLCGGLSLLEYFRSHKKEWAYYVGFLRTCPIMSLVESEKIFYYLVHGAPLPYQNGEKFWNYVHASLNGTPTFKEDLVTCLLHHPAISIGNDVTDQMLQKITPENLYCIVGHTPTKYIRGKGKQCESQKMYYKNHIYDIDCGCRANTLGKPMSGNGMVNIKSSLCMMRLGTKPKCFYVQSNA